MTRQLRCTASTTSCDKVHGSCQLGLLAKKMNAQSGNCSSFWLICGWFNNSLEIPDTVKFIFLHYSRLIGQLRIINHMQDNTRCKAHSLMLLTTSRNQNSIRNMQQIFLINVADGSVIQYTVPTNCCPRHMTRSGTRAKRLNTSVV